MNELLQSRTMKLMVHLSLVLLNILWVSFFYTDPLEVFVQRRSSSSSDEEMMVGEFCLQTPSDLMWTFHVSADGTTTDVPNREKKNKPDQTNSEPTSAAGTSQLVSSRSSEAAPVRTTGSSKEDQHVTVPNREKKNKPDQSYSEPKHLNSPQFLQTRTPTVVSSIRGLNEATAASPSLHKPTSAAGTSQLVSSRSSEAAPVRTTGSSKEDQHVTDSCCSEYSSINVPLDVIVGVNMSSPECPLPAVMFITSSDQLICADPCETFTVQMIDSMSTTEETSPSDKRSEAAPVRQRVKRFSYDPCCLGHSSIRRIPLSRIQGYRIQDRSVCGIQAIMLITTRGQEFCVDPDEEWIQRTLERLQRREKLQCLTDIIKSSSFAKIQN